MEFLLNTHYYNCYTTDISTVSPQECHQVIKKAEVSVIMHFFSGFLRFLFFVLLHSGQLTFVSSVCWKNDIEDAKSPRGSTDVLLQAV